MSHRTGLVLRMRIVCTVLKSVPGAGIAPMCAGPSPIAHIYDSAIHWQRSLRCRPDCCQGKSDFHDGLWARSDYVREFEAK